MSAITSLIKGGAWLTLANLVSKIASALALPILARVLGPESLGIYSVVFSTAIAIQSFSSFGIDIAIHRKGAQYETLGRDAVGRVFGVGLALMCGISAVTGSFIFIWREPLAQHWLGKAEVAPWLGLTAMLIVLQPLGNVPLLFLASLHAFRAYALRSSVGMLISSGVSIFMAWGFGLTGAVNGLILVAGIQIIWSYFIVKPVLQAKKIRLRFDQFWQESATILRFGFPYYFGSTLLGSIVGLPLMGLVSQYSGLKELGYLRVAISLASLIGFIPSAIAPAAISYLSASTVDSSGASYLKSVHIRSMWAVAVIAVSAVCPLLPILIHGLYGATYQPAIVLAWVHLWLTVLVCITSVLIQFLVAEGKTLRVCWASSASVMAWVIASLLLVPRYNALGFLVAQIMSQLVLLACTLHPALLINRANTDFSQLRNLGIITVVVCSWTLILRWIGVQGLPLYGVSIAMTLLVIAVLFYSVLSIQEQEKITKLLGRWRI